MRTVVGIATLALATTMFATPAFADEPAPAGGGAAAGASATAAPAAAPSGGEAKASESGLSFGIRSGYMIPMGEAVKGGNLSDGFSGGVPIWLDIGYRINPNFYVGAYGDFAFLFYKPDCPSPASCSANQIRFGANVHYHIMPDATIDPWVGLGLGYEIVNTSVSAGGKSIDGSFKGFEFANIQVGGDYKLTPNIAVGPFLSFSLGQYSTGTSTNPVTGQSTSGDITDKGIHEWFTIGLRGKYDL